MVVFDAVAERAQEVADLARESWIRCRAIAVANHEIRMLQARKTGREPRRDSRHGMAVDVDAVPMPRVRRFDGLRDCLVVRPPASLDPAAHLSHRQFAGIERFSIVGATPNQAFAKPDLGQNGRIGFNGVGPGLVEQCHVDFGQVAIGVQVAARKQCLDPRHLQGWREVVELFHVGVFGRPQQRWIAAVTEIRGIVNAAVGRVEHHGSGAREIDDHRAHVPIVAHGLAR